MTTPTVTMSITSILMSPIARVASLIHTGMTTRRLNMSINTFPTRTTGIDISGSTLSPQFKGS